MQKSIIMQKSTIKKGIFMVLPVFASCNGAGSFVGNHTNITKTAQHKPFDRLDAIYEERAQACGEAYKRISINLDTSLSCTRRLANEILSCPSMDKSEFQKLSQRKKNFVVTLIAKSIVAKRSTIALKSFRFEDLLHLVYMFAEFRFFGKWHDKETLIASALCKITMEMERQASGSLEATRVLNSLTDLANCPSDLIACKAFENALSKYRGASKQ